MHTYSRVNDAPKLSRLRVVAFDDAALATASAAQPGKKNGKARILDESQVASIIQHIRSTSHSPESDEVKFLLSVRAGLRVAEIAGLKLPDLFNADGKLGNLVHVSRHIGKGRKGRTVPMHPQLKEALLRLHAAFPLAQHVCFTKRQPRRVQSIYAVTHWFSRIYRELGLFGCSSHSGRRTFITNLARIANEADYSLRDVQQLAGHARLDTTALYIDPADNLGALIAALGAPRKRAA